MISPTIISKQQLNFKPTSEFHPSGNMISFLQSKVEIKVGEIVVKSPYGTLSIERGVKKQMQQVSQSLHLRCKCSSPA